MDPSIIAFIALVAAIGLVVGGIIGWLLASLRGDKNTEQREQPTATKVEAPANHRLYLRVWKNTFDGGLIFDLRGKRLADADTLSQEERDEVLKLLEDTADWLGLPEVQDMQPIPSTSERTSERTSESRSYAGEDMETGNDPLKPTFMGGVTEAIADVINPSPKSARNEPKSIVQQIDVIFQEKLADSEFAGQRIYIVEDARKGVAVWIGNAMYEGVGAVPEGEIKNILRSSVLEWEKLQEKGRRGATTG